MFLAPRSSVTVTSRVCAASRLSRPRQHPPSLPATGPAGLHFTPAPPGDPGPARPPPLPEEPTAPAPGRNHTASQNHQLYSRHNGRHRANNRPGAAGSFPLPGSGHGARFFLPSRPGREGGGHRDVPPGVGGGPAAGPTWTSASSSSSSASAYGRERHSGPGTGPARRDSMAVVGSRSPPAAGPDRRTAAPGEPHVPAHALLAPLGGRKKKEGGMRYCWYRGARAAPLTPVCLCVRPPRGPTPSPVSPNRHPPSPRQGPAPRDRHTPPSSPAIDTGPRRPRLRSLPPPRTPLPRQTEPPGPAPRLGATDTTAPSSPAHSAPPSGRARPLLETLPPGKGRGWNEAPSAAPRRSPWPSWRCGGAALSPGGRAAARATDGDGWSRPAAAHKMAAAAAERGP